MEKTPHPSAAVSPAWLLQRARVKSGLSQAQLASRAEVDQSLVSRTESGERHGDFVGVQQLVNHTNYRLVMRLLPAPYDRPDWDHALLTTPFKPSSPAHLVEKCLPEQLVDLYGDFRRGEEADGPTVGEALYWLGEIADVWHAASLPHRRLMEIWRLTRDTDAQALIHAVLDAGGGAAHAHQVLAVLIDELAVPAFGERRRRRPERRTARSSLVGRRAWAHVALSVRAEVWICEQRHGALLERGERYIAQELLGVARRGRLLFDELAETPGFRAWCDQEAPPEYLAWLNSDSELTWRDQERAAHPSPGRS